MRLFFDDLSRPKSAAKHLAALSGAVKLSTVHEMLARVSGYRDWHDLAAHVASAKSPPSSSGEDAAIVARLADALDLKASEVQETVARTKLIDGQAWTPERHAACHAALFAQRGRLTAAEIERAKATAIYRPDPPHHEHDDCIRMAYEWLDAQVRIKGPTTSTRPLKHIIEKWAGRYVSTSDVVVAANMHPDIRGAYPHFNISSRLTEPSIRRLDGIGEAFKHDYRTRFEPKTYARREG